MTLCYLRLLFLFALVGLAFTPRAAAQAQMELHLVLAFDASASVNDAEFALQRDGTADALRSVAVSRAIANAPGGVALSVVQWSSVGQQALGLDWVHLRSVADAHRVADRVEAMERRIEGGGTMIHTGLVFAADQLDSAPGAARRQVIDLSGNGRADDEERLRDVRDALLARGIVINGLAVEEDHDDLTWYYYRQVIGGPGAFVVTASDFPQFRKAIEIKLYREISGAVVSDAVFCAENGLENDHFPCRNLRKFRKRPG